MENKDQVFVNKIKAKITTLIEKGTPILNPDENPLLINIEKIKINLESDLIQVLIIKENDFLKTIDCPVSKSQLEEITKHITAQKQIYTAKNAKFIKVAKQKIEQFLQQTKKTHSELEYAETIKNHSKEQIGEVYIDKALSFITFGDVKRVISEEELKELLSFYHGLLKKERQGAPTPTVSEQPPLSPDVANKNLEEYLV